MKPGLPVCPPTAVAPPARARSARAGRLAIHLAGARLLRRWMTYLDNATIRRQLSRVFSVRATEGGTTIARCVTRILELRRRRRACSASPISPTWCWKIRMAHTGDRALVLPGGLESEDRERFRERIRNCSSSGGARRARSRPQLQPWDVAYYAEKQRAALYDFDEEALRPYFPWRRCGRRAVRDWSAGFTASASERTAFRCGIRKLRIIPSSMRTARESAVFYADWFPRENKRGGAWMDALDHRRPAPDGFSRIWA